MASAARQKWNSIYHFTSSTIHNDIGEGVSEWREKERKKLHIFISSSAFDACATCASDSLVYVQNVLKRFLASVLLLRRTKLLHFAGALTSSHTYTLRSIFFLCLCRFIIMFSRYYIIKLIFFPHSKLKLNKNNRCNI